MEAFLNNSRLFKIHLVQSERDLFGNPISSDEWDKIAELLYEDTKHKVFQFVHPKKKGIVYERRYKICPVNGLAMLEVGKQGDFLNRATVRLITKSYMYNAPYLVIEDFASIAKHVEVMAEIVRRAFNIVLKEYGLEVILEPWVSDEPIWWILDFEISHKQELKKHPEIAKNCKGYQDALEYEAKIKEMKENSEKKKISRRADCSFRDHIKVNDKDAVLKIAHDYTDGSNKACVVMIVQKAMNDAKVISRPSYRAFVEEFGSGEGRSAASYSELNNDHCHKYDRDPLYMKLLRIFSEFK